MPKMLAHVLVVTSALVFGSTSASALSLNAFVEAIFTDSSLATPAGGYSSSDGGTTGTAALVPGHAIIIDIEVANPENDLIFAIFASLVYQGDELNYLGAQLPDEMLKGDGPSGQSLENLNTGAVKGSQPNAPGDPGDVWIQAPSYALQAGTTGAGPDVIRLLFIVSPGVEPGDDLVFEMGMTAGDSIAGASSVTFSSAVIHVIPEPGTALLVGLGLVALVGMGRPA